MKKRVIGIGEVTWDLLPAGACLGGAPGNFAYITTLLGDEGILASSVGQDPRAQEALQRLRQLRVNVDHVQTDNEHPTSTVNVELDAHGHPRFDIVYPVAWDFLQWTPDWLHLAEKADAVCFGSLAQRSEQSRTTIRKFVETAAARALIIFDVNLREPHYSAEVLLESMRLAKILKLNDDELPKVMTLSRLSHDDELSSARKLLEAHGLELVCITRGGRGSLLVRGDAFSEHPGFKVQIADTVGAGDAFTAGIVHEYLRGSSLDRMNHVANRLGSWVASEMGATPSWREGNLKRWLDTR